MSPQAPFQPGTQSPSNTKDEWDTSSKTTAPLTASPSRVNTKAPAIPPVRARRSRSRSRSPSSFVLPIRTRSPVREQRQSRTPAESASSMSFIIRNPRCPVVGCRSTAVHQHPPKRQHYTPRGAVDKSEIDPFISDSSRLIPNTAEWQAIEERREMMEADELARLLREDIERGQQNHASHVLQILTDVPVNQAQEHHSPADVEIPSRHMAELNIQDNSQIANKAPVTEPYFYDPDACISMQCPVGPAHPLGRYLARGHVPRTWNDYWGLSDPPHEVWQAWVRMHNGTAEDDDEFSVSAFSACHFWDGPEAANEAGERSLGRFLKKP